MRSISLCLPPCAHSRSPVGQVGDPGAYHVPDVACDMTHAKVEQVGMHRVRVSNVKGQPPTDTYKVIASYPNPFLALPIPAQSESRSSLG